MRDISIKQWKTINESRRKQKNGKNWLSKYYHPVTLMSHRLAHRIVNAHSFNKQSQKFRKRIQYFNIGHEGYRYLRQRKQ